ncbi:MAG: hypothetical protein JWL67_1461 [Solirubrobacterales bacterium]|jgi:hypothetical protein|nr:hypothetical protein [Solirubrobacterales bacterium]
MTCVIALGASRRVVHVEGRKPLTERHDPKAAPWLATPSRSTASTEVAAQLVSDAVVADVAAAVSLEMAFADGA